ncbi:MAG: glycosyltransferase family 39 protein [Phycisphaerae bacterium]|nr:glycosyltransferase family 39 protein [Phycisphaerae bacterium]
MAICVALYVAAIILRFAVLFQIKDDPTISQCHVLDMRGNHEFALAILDGLRPTTYYKAPFYTYFIAGVYAVTGTDPFNVRVVQIFLVSFIPVLTFLIGRFFFGEIVGAISGALAAVFWTFLYFSVELLDTELACLLYLLLAYLLVVMDDRRYLKWLICGALLGWGATTRPNILAYAPILAILVLVIGWRRRARDAGVPTFWTPIRHALLLTIGCCAAIAPVTIRNRIIGGEWVLLGAYGGMNLYVANSPDSDSKDGPLLVDEESFVEPTTWDPNEPWARCCLNYYLAHRLAETELGRPPKPGEFSSILARKAMTFIQENPRWFARHALRRLCWLFNTYEFHSNRDFYDFRRTSTVLWVASGLQFGMICPFALLGLALALARKEQRAAPMAYYVGMLASLAFPAVLFIINARFRLPMVHLLMPFAAYGLLQAIARVRAGVAWPTRLKTFVPLALLAAFCNLNLFDYWSSPKGHLKWTQVVACEKAGRDDLLPNAVAEFEQELQRDLKDPRPGNVTKMLRHANAIGWLMSYHDHRGNREKALEYARTLLSRDPREPIWLVPAFKLLLEAGDAKHARDALNRMGRRLDPGLLGDCWLRYALAFGDRSALVEAEESLNIAKAFNPTQLNVLRSLDRVRQLLGTGPASSRDAPHSRPATQAGPTTRQGDR